MALWVDLADADAQEGFWFGRPDGTQNRILVRPASITVEFTGQPNLVVATPSLLDGWHHVGLTYQDGVRILYLDGTEAGRDRSAPIRSTP